MDSRHSIYVADPYLRALSLPTHGRCCSSLAAAGLLESGAFQSTETALLPVAVDWWKKQLSQVHDAQSVLPVSDEIVGTGGLTAWLAGVKECALAHSG